MIYTLLIWTVVAMDTPRGTQYDWRPLATFESSQDPRQYAKEKCLEAIRELGIKSDRARCIKVK